jgi:hypothetical protein
MNIDTPAAVRRALLIGINYYGQDAELSGCINDITDVEVYLRQIGFTEFTILKDFSEEDIDHDSITATRPDILPPTADNIIAAMRAAVTATRPGDTLYVHYSGHGSYVRDISGDERDGRDECIYSVDGKLILDDVLNVILVKGLVAGAKLRVVFDSCHSGSCLDLPISWRDRRGFVREGKSIGARDMIFISGCEDDQTSADSEFQGRANGALTWALLHSLRELNANHPKYSWGDLCELVRHRLRLGGYTQTPQLSMCDRDQTWTMVDLI